MIKTRARIRNPLGAKPHTLAHKNIQTKTSYLFLGNAGWTEYFQVNIDGLESLSKYFARVGKPQNWVSRLKKKTSDGRRNLNKITSRQRDR